MFSKVETQFLLENLVRRTTRLSRNGYPCLPPAPLAERQDLGLRSLLAVLSPPPPTSTEKTTQGPRPTVLAVLPTPPPPTTQGPRLPGGKKNPRSWRCCHHHPHPPLAISKKIKNSQKKIKKKIFGLLINPCKKSNYFVENM